MAKHRSRLSFLIRRLTVAELKETSGAVNGSLGVRKDGHGSSIAAKTVLEIVLHLVIFQHLQPVLLLATIQTLSIEKLTALTAQYIRVVYTCSCAAVKKVHLCS